MILSAKRGTASQINILLFGDRCPKLFQVYGITVLNIFHILLFLFKLVQDLSVLLPKRWEKTVRSRDDVIKNGFVLHASFSGHEKVQQE